MSLSGSYMEALRYSSTGCAVVRMSISRVHFLPMSHVYWVLYLITGERLFANQAIAAFLS